MTELNKAAILEWVEALESGEYQQTTGTLAKYVQGLPSPISYCCLGVACDVFKNRLGLKVGEEAEGMTRFLTFNHQNDQLPSEVHKFLGLASGDPVVLSDDGACALSYLNDEHGKTFAKIAALLRAHYLEEDNHD